MVTPAERTSLFLAHHGCLAIPAAHDMAFAAAEVHTTAAGNWIDLGDPFSGLLTLADGHAVLELAARATSPPGDLPPDAADVLRGKPTERDERFGVASARRTRLGVAETLKMRPPVFDARARAAWPKLSVYALSTLTWIWQPEQGTKSPESPVTPLDSIHDDFSRYLARGVQPFIASFPTASALSFDAARVVASFGRVVHLGAGETLVALGDDTHAGIVMAGSIESGSHLLRPGELLHPHRFGPGPFSAVSAVETVRARQDSVVALFPHAMLTQLTEFDPRRAVASPGRPTRILHLCVGDADEARPDGQTMALQTAATLAREMAFPGMPGGVLYIDLDGARFKDRLPEAIGRTLPLVTDLRGIPALPSVEPWATQGLALSLVAIHLNALADVADVARLIDLCLPALPGSIAHVVVRVPRSLASRIGPAYHRAYSVSVSGDHLLEPIPVGIPAVCDIVHMRRFGRHESSYLVEEMVAVRFERTDDPTKGFWKTGLPWCLAVSEAAP